MYKRQINGSILSKTDLIFWPFNGGSISNVNLVLPFEFSKCSVIFIKIILPLSITAFASIFILQFLWVWNDLLVGLVFLDQVPSEIIITAKLRELLGSRGENWEILTTGAFVSMTVPLAIFFLLQRYFIRGLVAGSVKG